MSPPSVRSMVEGFNSRSVAKMDLPKELTCEEKNALRIARIGPHPALKSSNTTLSINLDFTVLSHRFFMSEAYEEWRTALVEALWEYRTFSTRIFIAFIYPHHKSTSVSTKQCQKELVAYIIELINLFKGMQKCEIVVRSPETCWAEVQMVAPLYRIKFKTWTMRIKEGQHDAMPVNTGGDWDRRLRGHCRNLVESGELTF